jgi:hypothetical protein
MAEVLTLPDTQYSLAGAAILSQAAVEQPTGSPRRISIRRLERTGSWPQSFVKSTEAVVELLKLPAGWNSYAAKVIAPQNAVQAIRFLADFVGPDTPQPAVVPRVQGGIQIEWHTMDIDIEVYIDAPGKIRWFAERAQAGETIEGPLAGHEAALKALLRQVSGK